MSREEFINILKGVLQGSVSERVVQENVQYYQQYIQDEVASGKSEEDVLELLGDPRLIARTIIETNSDGSTHYEDITSNRERDQRQGNGTGSFSQIDLTGTKSILVILAIIIVLFAILWTVGSFIAWALPVLIPVILVVWLIRMFSNR